MNYLRILGLTSVLVFQAGVVQAESVTRKVGDTDLQLAVPSGYCVLQESNSHDAQFINVVETLLRNANNKLILLMMECERLKTWRASATGSIYNYITYYTPHTEVDQVHSGDSHELRKALCADMRGQKDTITADVKAKVAQAAKELRKNIAVNTTQYIGVVEEDLAGCYAELLVGVRGNDTDNLLMATMIISTYMRGKALFSAIYRKYEGGETFQYQLEMAKEEVRQLAADNNDP